MIQFRCWYCRRRYSLPESRIGERLTCSCTRRLRVPKRSGGSSRTKTAVDWLVEALVYGGGGALLGLGLALLVISQTPVFLSGRLGWLLAAALTGLGFL